MLQKESCKGDGCLCSEVEHQLEGEGPWGLPDGSDDCEIIFTPGHTEAHCVLLYKPQKVTFRGMHHSNMTEDGPSATPHMHGAGIVLSLRAEDEYWVACLQWLLQTAQVLFSGDHLAANAVGEWITKYEDADDGFLGISRHFNCEPKGYILRLGIPHWMHSRGCV